MYTYLKIPKISRKYSVK